MANGKICYVEIPADDVAWSAAFYAKVFGWAIRTRSDGTTAFDDATGAVSGSWVTGRRPAASGVLVYVMVESIERTVATVIASGGTIETPRTMHPGGTASHATFRDPAGNLFGLYQE